MSGMLSTLRKDIDRLRPGRRGSLFRIAIEVLLFDNGFQAVVLHRVAHWFKQHRIPFFGPFFGRLSQFLTGVEIAPGCEIGPGLQISHGNGIVIGQWARIGANATLLHQVTIGAPSASRVEQMPRLGDGVFVGAGARLIGGIEIGDDVFIGTNSVVAQDVPSHSKVTCGTGITIRGDRREAEER